MIGVVELRIAISLAGIVVFGIGVRNDIEWLRWAGIGLLAASLLARFLPGGRAPRRAAIDDDAPSSGDAPPDL